mmetsp:Transcript_110776/g.324095  ORF Transcript_110776/g.324095 Transcript_110776/m.324095 type:complete len:204 (-) Transcript_110776:1076-1687(-)
MVMEPAPCSKASSPVQHWPAKITMLVKHNITHHVVSVGTRGQGLRSGVAESGRVGPAAIAGTVPQCLLELFPPGCVDGFASARSRLAQAPAALIPVHNLILAGLMPPVSTCCRACGGPVAGTVHVVVPVLRPATCLLALCLTDVATVHLAPFAGNAIRNEVSGFLAWRHEHGTRIADRRREGGAAVSGEVSNSLLQGLSPGRK